jgi:hypothetical protein
VTEGNVLNINTEIDYGRNYALAKSTSRLPLDGGRTLIVNLYSSAPARANSSLTFNLEVAKDCDIEDSLVLYNPKKNDIFEARITELIPTLTPALLLRLSMRVKGILGEAIVELTKQAAESLRNQD